MLIEAGAVITAGVGRGAGTYINLVQQPAIAKLGTAQAVAFLAPMYARAAPMEAFLAVNGALCGLRS